jgi:hypothetical protein
MTITYTLADVAEGTHALDFQRRSGTAPAGETRTVFEVRRGGRFPWPILKQSSVGL